MRKDIYFNDATCIIDDEKNAEHIIHQYAETIKEALSNQGFHKVCYEHSAEDILVSVNETAIAYCLAHSLKKDLEVILSTQTKPYIEENSSAEIEYVNQGIYEIEICDKYIESYSITAALYHKSITIGLANHGFETRSVYNLRQRSNPNQVVQMLCITSSSQFEDCGFITWAQKCHFYPQLLESSVPPSMKKIHLSKHHGIHELTLFAKKLNREPYVVGVVNSIDRDSGERQLIHAFHDKLIELRLLDGKGYGLVIETTARNNRELCEIIRNLEEKYT